MFSMMLVSCATNSGDTNTRKRVVDGVLPNGPNILKIGPPIYPGYCADENLEGYVDFILTIDTKGKVKEPVVEDVYVYRGTEMEAVKDVYAEELFIESAIKSLGYFRFEVTKEDGIPVDFENMKTRISFKLED